MSATAPAWPPTFSRSYEVTIVSSLILGLALMALEPNPALKMRWIV